jgi:hypothetical protein
MKVTVQVVLHADDDTETVVREAFTVQRDVLVPETLGLQLDEAKDLLAAVQETLVEHQVPPHYRPRPAAPTAESATATRTAVGSSIAGHLAGFGRFLTACDPPVTDLAPAACFGVGGQGEGVGVLGAEDGEVAGVGTGGCSMPPCVRSAGGRDRWPAVRHVLQGGLQGPVGVRGQIARQRVGQAWQVPGEDQGAGRGSVPVHSVMSVRNCRTAMIRPRR